jgi:hypothetical protein
VLKNSSAVGVALPACAHGFKGPSHEYFYFWFFIKLSPFLALDWIPQYKVRK